MPDSVPPPSLWKGALAGLAAGLVASFAMNRFQAALAAAGAAPRSHGEPSARKAADDVAVLATGAPVPNARKPAAGQAVHYVLGAALGLGYGALAEVRPAVTAGAGTGFGLATSAVIDETAVPALGLSPPPWRSSPNAHLYGVVSHLAFGVATEAARRAVRRLLG